MPEAVLTKRKVQPGKVDRLREWMTELRDREDEVAETLRNEGVHAESAFLEHTDDGTDAGEYEPLSHVVNPDRSASGE